MAAHLFHKENHQYVSFLQAASRLGSGLVLIIGRDLDDDGRQPKACDPNAPP